MDIEYHWSDSLRHHMQIKYLRSHVTKLGYSIYIQRIHRVLYIYNIITKLQTLIVEHYRCFQKRQKNVLKIPYEMTCLNPTLQLLRTHWNYSTLILIPFNSSSAYPCMEEYNIHFPYDKILLHKKGLCFNMTSSW